MASRLQSIADHLSSSSSSQSPAMTQQSPFNATPLAPPDPIFQLTAAFKQDSFKDKVNLGVGAYRDNDGKPYVLPVVRKVKKALADDPQIDHEYLPITGLPEFAKAAANLVFDESSPTIKEDRAISVQTISGTGANHLGGLFLSRFYEPWHSGNEQQERAIYISDPTWANHNSIFSSLGLTVKKYPYYDPATIGLNRDAFVDFLANKCPPRSVILLHACAHNPTGVDPSRDDWKRVADVCEQRGHFAFFDSAYQGFATASLANDAWAVRHFAERGTIPMLVCQSFAKNAGLYGERVGALHIVARDADEAKRLRSQLSVLQRAEISNPPAFGARIVAKILTDQQLFKEWEDDVATMSNRIKQMRARLYDVLVNELKTPPPTQALRESGTKPEQGWKHITEQIGMFSFTGLSPGACKSMVDDHHVYMTGNGRISMAGLNDSNVEYVARCIDKVVRDGL